jgi:CBS domain containing-hemolysin-like protein
MLEAIILSVTPSYLSSLKQKNLGLYEKVSYLKNDIEKPLASILTFNTIAHTIGAAGAGAEAQSLWGNEYLAIFSAVLTFIILFFSEIIPKSIGAKNWKLFLPMSYYFLKPMIYLSYPIVWISTQLSNIIKGKSDDGISRDEIPAIAELAYKSGALKKEEFLSLKNLIAFNKVELKQILKSADKVAGVRGDVKVDEAYELISSNTFSRLIVFGVHQNDIKGYVLRKQILQAYIDKKDITVNELSRKILILSEHTSGQVLFERLIAMKAHIAAVINENGEFIGIVTLEDLIENLLGQNIYDEDDES